ncbi:MAG: tRNA (adenosine(37)-N6)-dimethylallyltransferase MiaA [Chlamydiae bacterium CG10_big_fil_rev_8_21_14_0_10_35_9]|nr:MAG: tRNA (adenosine(37)-N6)-dimethylallyltransferase MiaA [Chlamydiae bacterium CG10_big_fil_rev_8_21_14_0_10_35_9]
MSFNQIEHAEIHPILSDAYEPLNNKKRIIVISGPTASGKTKLSLDLAKIIGGEIISADSMQVYQKMDIGTAKVSKEIRQEIPHHLIDICTLQDSFNVVQFYNVAIQACKEILERGNVPIIVGGTGFYIHALLYGPPKGPPSDPNVRKELELSLRKHGAEALYEKLQMLDPKYAATITEKDKHKIVRALEIIKISKKKVSDLPKAKPYRVGKYDFRCWFIYYPKEILYDRINYRCDQMIEDGFVEEVTSIKDQLENNPVASQAIGYKQCLKFLKTNQTKDDFELFLEEFKKVSRNYAKKQFTWFRKEPFFRWANMQELDYEYLKEIILQDFEIR